MSNSYTISVMSEDRVGIVADVSSAIRDLGGNLADLSQTVLRGYFTMILLADFPENVDASQIRESIERAAADSRFDIGIRRCPEMRPAPRNDAGEYEYVLTTLGPDQSGLVAGVTGFLRDENINIEDLSTTVEKGCYTMILLLDLRDHQDVAALRRRMHKRFTEMGIEFALQHHDIFKATNEV